MPDCDVTLAIDERNARVFDHPDGLLRDPVVGNDGCHPIERAQDQARALAELADVDHDHQFVGLMHQLLLAAPPRTRNAQVALFQSGDVDYLIATDAIGMGLNLDVDHVAFASD